VATLLHDPDVLILDEPMSGLDPVGLDLVRGLLLDLSRQGKTILLSSHQMETVERLCQHIALIHGGEKLLEGRVGDVKRRHGHDTLALEFEGGDGSFLRDLPGVRALSDHGQYVELRLHAGADTQALLLAAAARLRLRRFEIVAPSLHDVFVEQVTAHGGALAGDGRGGAA